MSKTGMMLAFCVDKQVASGCGDREQVYEPIEIEGGFGNSIRRHQYIEDQINRYAETVNCVLFECRNPTKPTCEMAYQAIRDICDDIGLPWCEIPPVKIKEWTRGSYTTGQDVIRAAQKWEIENAKHYPCAVVISILSNWTRYYRLKEYLGS